jgi:short-subunit dehydrogenase
MSKRIWIIGGSTGIGLELVKNYLTNNDSVVVSSRSAVNSGELNELQIFYAKKLVLINIDVSNTSSVINVTKEAWNAFSGIDLCIYNAGIYESMQVDGWNIEYFEQMMQTNYLGGVRITNALAPLFLENGEGSLAFNISVASYFGLPYASGYSAPKAALLNFCESIQPEFKEKNIDVQVINHGFVKTRLTVKNKFWMPQLLEPETAADIIFEKLEYSKNFEIKFPFILSSFLHLLRVLPYKISLYFTSKVL